MHYLIINSRFGSKLLAARLPMHRTLGKLIKIINITQKHWIQKYPREFW